MLAFMSFTGSSRDPAPDSSHLGKSYFHFLGEIMDVCLNTAL